MFARVAALLPFVLLASASHLKARDVCNSGSVQCCNSVENYHKAMQNPAVASILSSITAAPEARVGITCTPVTVLGAGTTQCTGQTVCCENNNFQGVVAIGCTPVNIGA